MISNNCYIVILNENFNMAMAKFWYNSFSTKEKTLLKNGGIPFLWNDAESLSVNKIYGHFVAAVPGQSFLHESNDLHCLSCFKFAVIFNFRNGWNSPGNELVAYGRAGWQSQHNGQRQRHTWVNKHDLVHGPRPEIWVIGNIQANKI